MGMLIKIKHTGASRATLMCLVGLTSLVCNENVVRKQGKKIVVVFVVVGGGGGIFFLGGGGGGASLI